MKKILKTYAVYFTDVSVISIRFNTHWVDLLDTRLISAPDITDRSVRSEYAFFWSKEIRSIATCFSKICINDHTG